MNVSQVLYQKTISELQTEIETVTFSLVIRSLRVRSPSGAEKSFCGDRAWRTFIYHSKLLWLIKFRPSKNGLSLSWSLFQILFWNRYDWRTKWGISSGKWRQERSQKRETKPFPFLSCDIKPCFSLFPPIKSLSQVYISYIIVGRWLMTSSLNEYIDLRARSMTYLI